MPADLSPRLRCIAEIFDSTKSINNAKLVYLSSLNRDELEFLSEIWTKTDLRRSRRLLLSLYI
jgi:hypothetical protein